MRTAAAGGEALTAALHRGARQPAAVGGGRPAEAQRIRLMCELHEADRKLGAAIALAEINEVLRDGDREANAGRGSRDAAKVAAFLAAAVRESARGRRR